MAIRVKTAKGRKISSTRWLQRQLNDPYVIDAKKKGYRARSAYKLIEIDDKFSILRRGGYIADLGAMPGGWSQVALQRTLVNNTGYVCAIDMQDMLPLPGVEFIKCDMTGDLDIIHKRLQGKTFDTVLSDMSAQSCGHRQIDHSNIINLCRIALTFAQEFLHGGGAIVLKILQGEDEQEFVQDLKKSFKIVKYFKPKASRADSSEIYLVGLGYRKSINL